MKNPSPPAPVAVTILAILAVLFAMREAQAIVIPFLMAFFLAMVAQSPVKWLHQRRVARIAAILLVVVAIAIALLVLGLLMGSSVQQLSDNAPAYEQALREKMAGWFAAGDLPVAADGGDVFDYVSPDAAIGLATGFLGGVGDVFSNIFLILGLMIFLLLEVPLLEAKLEALGSPSETWDSIEKSVRGYLAIKTLTSFTTGLLVGLFLAVVGVDFAVLWGLLAFLLNFVPNIGSLLAAVPAVLLALVQHGLGTALVVIAGYAVINMVVGNVVEPRLMGQGLGLSTLVVFLSLIGWGWLLGAPGMLLSVPLTTTLKIVLEYHEGTRPIALLLSGSPPAAVETETSA